jgi:hypothetical protein
MPLAAWRGGGDAAFAEWNMTGNTIRTKNAVTRILIMLVLIPVLASSHSEQSRHGREECPQRISTTDLGALRPSLR